MPTREPVVGDEVDVVVVGCGPVGVMMALRCAQRGLSVTAVDRSTEIFPLPRAMAMDEEVQSVFDRAGLIEQLREVSTPVWGAEFVDAGGTRVVGLELPEGTTGPLGHPPMVMFEQPLVEQMLREAACESGVELRLGLEATSLELDPHPVVGLRDVQTGDVSRIAARWLIGADGASSTTRRLLGVRFADEGFDQEWLVVDATEIAPFGFPAFTTQVCDPDRIVTLVPGHATRRRWEFKLNEGETPDDMLKPDRICDLLAPWGRPDQVRVDRAAVYRFHATVAERFRVGPAFLAGDAAHQMPPFNGQGMCSGVRDAENLSWKLAMVAASRAGDSLLDTYDLERRPHAEAQVRHSADAGRLIDAIAAGADADTAAGYGGGRPFPHLEDGLLDGDHPAVGRPLPDPALDGGDRLGSRLGEGFALLIRGAAPSAASWWVDLGATVVNVPHGVLDDLVPAGGCAIVRPDRYLAAVTTDLAGTTARLASSISPQG